MPSVRCPKCDRKYRLDPSSAGRKLRCGGCKAVFRIRSKDQAPPPRPAESASVVSDEDPMGVAAMLQEMKQEKRGRPLGRGRAKPTKARRGQRKPQPAVPAQDPAEDEPGSDLSLDTWMQIAETGGSPMEQEAHQDSGYDWTEHAGGMADTFCAYDKSMSSSETMALPERGPGDTPYSPLDVQAPARPAEGNSARDVETFPNMELVRFVGKGQASTVWEARNLTDGKVWAVKRVVRRHRKDRAILNEASRELEISSRLDHIGIRKVLDVHEVKNYVCIREVQLLMEYIDGISLADARPNDLDTVLSIFRQIALAMDDFQAAGLVHTDLQPANIMVDNRGNARVIDLGRTCQSGKPLKNDSADPAFAAPECFKKQPLDMRADVYSLAASLFWSVRGQRLPDDFEQRPDYLNREETALPIGLRYLLVDCLQTYPTQRPTTWLDIIQRLDVVQQEAKAGTGPDAEPAVTAQAAMSVPSGLDRLAK